MKFAWFALAITTGFLAALCSFPVLALEDDEISDDEVLRRDADLESGRVSEISHQEFVRRVQSERKRDQ